MWKPEYAYNFLWKTRKQSMKTERANAPSNISMILIENSRTL